MAKAKKKKTSSRSKSEREALLDGPGRLAGLAERSGRVGGGLILTGLAVGWMLGLRPLEERVAAIRSDPVEVAFAWPTTRDRPDATWAPAGVRAELRQIVLASVGMDPFDGEGLSDARRALLATGWFRRIDAVRRRPSGSIEITGAWRAPAAVVERGNRWYLVGLDSAPMRLPAGSSAPAELFRIFEPFSPPRREAGTGRTLYGEPWPDSDVSHAIALLDRIANLPGSDAIVGVDLRQYASRGWLSLITDSSCELVWGAPVGESAPGEASVERKLDHLGQILEPGARLDLGQRRVELMTEHVFVDRSASESAANR